MLSNMFVRIPRNYVENAQSSGMTNPLGAVLRQMHCAKESERRTIERLYACSIQLIRYVY